MFVHEQVYGILDVSMKHLSLFWVQSLFVVSIGFLMGYTYIVSASKVWGMTQCHTISTSQIEVRKGFGSPFDLFSDSKKLAMQVLCSEDGARLTVGTGDTKEYILEYGFQMVDGKWKKVPFVGEKKVGSWYVGSAKALFEKSTLEDDKKTKILAYICRKVDGRWKCGCRDEMCTTPYWQMQEFVYDKEYKDLLNNDTNTSKESLYAKPISQNIGPVGTKVELEGKGFSKSNNTVYFDDVAVAKGLTTSDKNTVSFTVPDTVSPGLKRISVKTETGEEIVGTSYLVTVPGFEKPILTSMTPEKGKYGTEVTLHGKNFSKDNNQMLVGYDMFEGIPSKDGTSLTFKMEPMRDSLSNEAMGGMDGDVAEVPVHVLVVNNGGISESEKVFIMEI
jgi:hypothetical protein